jgi:hypothetical protein
VTDVSAGGGRGALTSREPRLQAHGYPASVRDGSAQRARARPRNRCSGCVTSVTPWAPRGGEIEARFPRAQGSWLRHAWAAELPVANSTLLTSVGDLAAIWNALRSVIDLEIRVYIVTLGIGV